MRNKKDSLLSRETEGPALRRLGNQTNGQGANSGREILEDKMKLDASSYLPEEVFFYPFMVLGG